MRWPKSIHSQVKAVSHSVRAFGESKQRNINGIRSLGTWNSYTKEFHKFADYLKAHNCKNILDLASVRTGMKNYLNESYLHAQTNGHSRQTFETKLAALSKLEHGINTFMAKNKIESERLNTKDLRNEFSKIARHKEYGLTKSSRTFPHRSYHDPKALISQIKNPTHKLQAAIQYEGGLRAEGVGAASNGMSNPITISHLGGLIKDPVTGQEVGLLQDVVEKGGKATDHMISQETYHKLEDHIRHNGSLESNYKDYLKSINEAAKATGQYEPGRGSHGLKHNFAQERYLECVHHGLTHEQAMQQTSLELAHFRHYETLTYTRG